MAQDVLFDSDYLHLSYDDDMGFVWARWKGMTSSDNMKSGTDLYIDAFIKHNTGKVMIDMQEVNGTFTAINDWLVGNWTPRALKAGMKACALIHSADIFTKFAMNKINDQYEKGQKLFGLRLFGNWDEGKDWLNTF